MASIIKRKNGYEVQWIQNKKRQYKFFKTRKDAKVFCAVLETQKSTPNKLPEITLKALINEYERNVSVKKRSYRSETFRLNRFRSEEFSKELITNITKAHINDYIERRSKERSQKTRGFISASTINKEMALLRNMFNYAIEFGFLEKNPLSSYHKLKEPEHRERIAVEEDIEKLLVASGWDGISTPKTSTQAVIAAFLFSCRTGMRAGEILKMETSWVEDRVIHIPPAATKTLSKRNVAMGTDAYRYYLLMLPLTVNGKVFGCISPASRDVIFKKVRNRAGLGPVYDSAGNLIKEGLNFHDGRATFATWAATPDPHTGVPRLDVLALARQTGHKNLAMLQRYYREPAEKIVERLS